MDIILQHKKYNIFCYTLYASLYFYNYKTDYYNMKMNLLTGNVRITIKYFESST